MSNEENHFNGEVGKRSLGVLKFSVLVFTVALALAVISFLALPKIHEHSMNGQLKKLQENTAPITVENNKIDDVSKLHKNVKINGANSKQKYLTKNGEDMEGVVYTNGKNISHRKNVDLYIDLNESRSKDFINLNGGLLKSLVENGKIILTVHPINNGDKNSILAGEALIESAAAYPSNSWDYLTNITKINLNSTNGGAKKLSETAKRLKLDFIDDKSITNGTFAAWIYELNNSSKIKSSYSPPILYVDNKVIDSQKININDPTVLESAISNG